MTRSRHAPGRRHRRHEEHTNHEAWAIPYADLLTLLLAFFAVMYAMSSVNAGKYRVLSDSLFAAFRGAPRSNEPIQIGDRQVGTGADMNATVVQESQLYGKEKSRLAPVPVATGTPHNAVLPPQAAAAAAALSNVADKVAAAMSQLVRKDLVTIRRTDFWIEVEMKSDILFPSGSAKLADDASGIIDQLGTVLAPFPNPIRVEGYTDNKPIKTPVFSSNWELSAARAGSVVRELSDQGVGPDRLAVVGYGEQRPLKPNNTVDNRNSNRRVVVVILSTELMRQQGDNNHLPDPAAPAPAITPAAAPTATPGASPDAPAPAAAPGTTLKPGDSAEPSRPTATRDDDQLNNSTGTEPAP